MKEYFNYIKITISYSKIQLHSYYASVVTDQIINSVTQLLGLTLLKLSPWYLARALKTALSTQQFTGTLD